MRIDLVKDIKEVDASQWNALAQDNATHTIFQTYEFNRVSQEVYGPPEGSFILCVKEGEALVAILPLMFSLLKGKRVLRFMAAERSDYCDILCPARQQEALEIIWKYIFSRRHEWDLIHLTNVPLETPLAKCIKESADIKNVYHRSSQDESALLSFKEDPVFAQGVMHKKSVLAYRHYFQSQGGYKVLHLRSREEIEGYLEDFFNQHIKRWQGTVSPSLFLDPKNKQFYRKIVRDLPKGWVTFTLLQAQGQVVGYHFGFLYGKRFIWYKPSFNTAFARHSPGQVLLQEVMEFAYSQGVEEFDFGNGKEAYKNRFSNKVSYQNSFKIFPAKKDYLYYYIPLALQWRLRKLGSQLKMFNL